MKKREPLMDQAYFDKWVSYEQQRIVQMQEKLAASDASDANKAKYRFSIFGKHYELLLLRYSQGESFSALKESFPGVVKSLEACHQAPEDKTLDFSDDIDDYATALWLVSLALLFEVNDELFSRLVSLIGNEGKDVLYERLVGTRIKNRPAAQRLLYPRPYRTLLEAIDASRDLQGGIMTRFLKEWYPGMKDAYWHDSHLVPDGGGFFGYWCLEAAGVVKAFKIDDSSFVDLRYYPKDLVHPAN